MSQGLCFNLGSQRHQRVPGPNLLHKSWYLGLGLGHSSNARMQAINLVVQRLTVVADIRRHSWGTHWYPFQATKNNFWILCEQTMDQNQTNPRCITNLPNALSIAVVSPLKNYATLLLFLQLNANILKMMCKYLMYMQWTANTCNLSKQQCLNLQKPMTDSIRCKTLLHKLHLCKQTRTVINMLLPANMSMWLPPCRGVQADTNTSVLKVISFCLQIRCICWWLLRAESSWVNAIVYRCLQDIFSPRSTVTNTQFSEGNGFEAFEFLLEFSIQLQASLPHIQ